MKTIIIVALCIVGYLAIGFCLLVLRARKHRIEFTDSAIMLTVWPIAMIVVGLDSGFTWVTNTARYLSEKLPK